MAHSLATKLGKRGIAGNCDAVGSTTLLSALVCVCVCVCVWVPLRVLSVETDLDVSRVASRKKRWMGGDWRRGRRKATVKLKGKKINRRGETGREGTMDSCMKYIKRLCDVLWMSTVWNISLKSRRAGEKSEENVMWYEWVEGGEWEEEGNKCWLREKITKKWWGCLFRWDKAGFRNYVFDGLIFYAGPSRVATCPHLSL